MIGYYLENNTCNECNKIDNCELYMYAEYGHGLYSEAKDFNQRVYDFLIK